jgi:hypothetical protein
VRLQRHDGRLTRRSHRARVAEREFEYGQRRGGPHPGKALPERSLGVAASAQRRRVSSMAPRWAWT